MAILAGILAATTMGGCAAKHAEPAPREGTVIMDQEPDRITVDHILIAVQNPRMPRITRTEGEAEQIADTILEELGNGGDWKALKDRYSDDRPGDGEPAGGPYAMTNRGTEPANDQEYPRDGMVPAFGNVGFTLQVGEVGVAHFDAADSPYGIHLILRVK
ncbi:MAG: peptidylprolyl isomerase [Planctomycetota bacterium]